MGLLSYDFMQRALIAAAIIGLVGPLVGIYLVQRRLALLGDGMGHIALTGVGLAFLLGTAPIPTAMVAAAIGAFLVEFIRHRSKTAGDIALALLFYGGIAGGVLLASMAGGKSQMSLNAYLFGSLSTVTAGDLTALVVLAIIIVAVTVVFGRELFAMSLDPDVASVQGVRVRALGTLLAVMAAVTVVIGMRVVGLLLVSAIMIVPVAAAALVTRSFKATQLLAVIIGLVSAMSGLLISATVEVPPGPTIILLCLAVFAVLAAVAVPIRRAIRNRAES